MRGRIVRRFWMVVPIALALGGCNGIGPGQGRVLDTETNQPIAGVELRFDCQVGHNIESYRTLRIVSVFTNDQGVYRFTNRDVSGCQFGSLSPYKTGYENMSGKELIWHSLDGYVFQLAPQAEATMRRLKIIHSATIKNASNAATHPFSSPKAEYGWVFFRFIDSRNMAKTDRERQFVKDSYCSRLIGLDERLSPAERDEITREREMVHTDSSAAWMTIDHGKEVLGTCNGASPP